MYQAADFFMIRFANLPMDSISLLNKENSDELISFYQKNHLFKEAIAIASYDLHQGLKKLNTIVDKTSLLQSLSKYLIRMSSRATPFGLFSSVGWGEFADRTNLSFNLDFLKKNVSLNTEYIGEFIKTLHAEKTIVRNLKVRMNPQLIYKKGRVFLNNDHPNFKENYISIRHSSAYEKVCEIAKTPIKYKELEEKVISSFTKTANEKIQNYIWELFQRNYLISELMDPFIFTHFEHSFSQVLSKIEKQSVEADLLKRVLSKIQEYETDFHEEKISLLEEIVIELQSKKKDVKNFLKVDLKYDSDQIQLHNNIQKAIEKAVNVLVKISYPKKRLRHLNEFHTSFLEQYGTERLVSFFEIMQSEKTLRLLTNDMETDIESELDPIENFLAKQFFQEKVDIKPFIEELKDLTPDQQQLLPPTMELCCEIETDDERGIEEGRLTLHLKSISNQAGAMFGRFLYFWDEKKQKQMTQFLENEEKILSSTVVVEPSFIPEKLKVGNVSIGSKLRLLHLPMNYYEDNEYDVELEDLYIGANFEKLYIFSKKLNKEVTISPTVMTNPIYMPLPLRFLLFLSQYQVHRSIGTIWNGFGKRIYYPRIVYENIVLSPAQWYLNYSLLKIDLSISKEKFSSSLKEAFIKHKIPQKIILVQGDNYLPLQWNKEWHFDLIVKEFLRNKEIILHEDQQKKIEKLAKENRYHAHEFVIPVKKKTTNPSSIKKYYPKIEQISLKERIFFPGGDWWYAQIFLPTHDADLFLSRFLFSFMKSIESRFENFKWFYIRYNKDGFHLRLRVNIASQSLGKKLIPELNQWLSTLAFNGEIEDFNLSPYKREIERYGGPECIELAEEVFHKDSECILNILERDKYPLPRYLIASMGILNIAHRFYPDVKDLLKIFTSNQDQLYLLDGIRSYSKIGISVAQTILSKEKASLEDENLRFLLESFSQMHFSLDQLVEKILKLEMKMDSWISTKHIINSLTHMHCNRLLGISHVEEQKARISASYILEKLLFRLQLVKK